MKKILFKNINYLLEIDDYYKIIIFESQKEFRNIYYNLVEESIFSIDGKEYNIENSILRMFNPLDLDINTKKNISNLYKSIEKHLPEEIIGSYEKLIGEINDFMNKIVYESDSNIEFDDELSMLNLFDALNLKYSVSKENEYIELLIQYIDIMTRINNYKLIVSFNLAKYLTNDELSVLINELRLLNIELLDICTKDESIFNVKKIIVDEDLIIL